MRNLSIEEIKAAADPVATCKEQLRRWKISYSRYCGSRRGGREECDTQYSATSLYGILMK